MQLSAWRFLLGIARGRRRLVGAALAVVVAGAACGVGSQYSMKLLIDTMSAPQRDVGAAVLALTVFLGLIGAENAMWRAGGWLGSRASIAVGADVRLALFDHVTGQSWRYFTRHMTGALANRFTTAKDSSTALLGSVIWNLVPPFIDASGSLIVLATVDWRLSAVLVVAGVLSGLALVRLGERGTLKHRAFHERAAGVLGTLSETLANIALVRAFNGHARERQRLLDSLQVEMRAQRRSWMHLEMMRAFYDIVLWLAAVLVLAESARQWALGAMSAGGVVVAIALSLRLLNASRELALSLLGASQQSAALTESLSVLLMPHDMADPPTAQPLRVTGGAIDFRAIRYSPGDSGPLFDGLDLHVPAGQRLGIVGLSGAGKSTLLRLLQRQDRVAGGAILIDGQDIGRVTRASLADALAVVTQEVELFHRSIMENIRYGRPEASDAEVMAAARAAQCDGFARALPDGYRAMVGERGVFLSGGQRQRIAIARAILKDAPITLLDEATSALDTLSEIEVQIGLEELTRGRTVLAVAHRLSTLTGFDRIVVLEAGRIIEDGSPAALIRQGGVFARMWRSQNIEGGRRLPELAGDD